MIFIVYLAFGSFMVNGPLELVIPYFISATGSETQMGIGLTMMSLGAFAGGLLITGLGGIRPRMKLIIAGAILTGPCPGLRLRTLAAAHGRFALRPDDPLPANNGLYKSILQVKVSPDLPAGSSPRGAPLPIRLHGLVSDHRPAGRSRLTPAGTAAWQRLTPLLGTGPAAAIGLVQGVTGLVLLAAAALTFSLRSVRRLEAELPDYQARVRGLTLTHDLQNASRLESVICRIVET